MSRRAGRIVSLGLLFLLSMWITGFVGRAAAAPVADQQCSSIGASFLDGIGSHEPAGQIFTPTQSSIVGFSIYVFSVSSDPTQMTANIRLGGIGGAVIASFVFSIPGNYGSPTGNWFPVQFPSGVHLTPGSQYAIDLTDNSGSPNIKWSSCSTSYSGGCGYADGTCQANPWAFIEYSGDFTIMLGSSTLVLVQGSSGSVVVTVGSLSNFASPVALSVSGATGIGGSFSDNPITPAPGGSASATLNIFVPGNFPVGTYPITVMGSSGSTTHSTTLTLNVVATGSTAFAVTSGPTVIMFPGSTATAKIFVTAFDGFNSQVGLAASWIGTAPADVSFNLPSPITPTTGGTATSTLTIDAGNTATPGTYTLGITATSGSTTHVVDLTVVIAPASTTTLTTTSASPDFSITSSSKTISIIQGLSGSTTIIVTSVGLFGSPVTFSASWVGSSPAGVGFTLPAPITPPAGGAGSSPMAVTATSTASTGSFDLRITGMGAGITHSVDITVQVTSPGPRCIIATATYGSALAPEVQLLRGYRDNALLKTNLGSSFMLVFNAWYYSFSPPVANYIANHLILRTMMQAALSPLIGILAVTYDTFNLLRGYPEIAILLSGILASCMIGSLYVGVPIAVVRRKIHRLQPSGRGRTVEKIIALILVGGLASLALGEFTKIEPVLMFGSVALVLSSASLSAAVTSRKVALFFDHLNSHKSY